MGLINGIASFGSGLSALAGNAMQDEDARAKSSLLNNAPPVADQPAVAPAAPTAPTTQDAATASVPVASATKGTVDLASLKPDLTRIEAPGGAKFTVAKEAAERFMGLITDLENAGYKIDPAISGGYNPRLIAGTNTPSLHAYGLAIDVNSERNQQGDKTQSDIPPDLAHALAAKYGLIWGGDWHGKTRDPMHFQVAGTRPDLAAA